MAKFTVDTHLFRELGELLVSRESTALVELIKNSYDADATSVSVYGENLGDPESAKIVLTDDGNGMTPEAFEKGFLRIASRTKEGAKRTSPLFGRRFTGAKGVGRLAAHKLAWRIDVKSVPNSDVFGTKARGVAAAIDWKLIESVDSLDEVESTNGVSLSEFGRATDQGHGTTITLSALKRRWTERQRSEFFGEIDSFLPPDALSQDVTRHALGSPLFKAPKIRDQDSKSKNFTVKRLGDLDVGEDQGSSTVAAADWIIDIDCVPTRGTATVKLMPTRKFAVEFPDATSRSYKIPLQPEADVAFQSRILFQAAKSWNRPGVRIYQEGFRVLPYGEQRNDWLELDEDYKRRGRKLRFLQQVPELDSAGNEDKDQGLSLLGNSSYYGAVFLTTERSKSLRMLVNREGFEWSSSFEEMKRVVRVSLDLLVRERAAYTLEKRARRREARRGAGAPTAPGASAAKSAISGAVSTARDAVQRARTLLKAGNGQGAVSVLHEGLQAIEAAEKASEALISDVLATRLLAALGLQLTAYVHEVNGLMVMIRQLAERSGELRGMLTGPAKTKAIQIDSRVDELRRSIEKQAQYLADVTSADARRRRSRQPIHDRFESAVKLYEVEASAQKIKVVNKIDTNLKTPFPMFSAELVLVFSNLLSNALKAAGRGGKIAASSKVSPGATIVRIENTGDRVKLSESDRWFQPFQSTTASSNIYLGQGMGMGLPITRELLEDYGASVYFTRPSGSFATAIELKMPQP